MSIENNKRIVEKFMDYFSKAKLDEAFKYLSDDAVWSLWGDNPYSGKFTKPEMKKMLLDSWQWFSQPVEWTPVAFTAEGNRVAVEAVSYCVTHGGYVHRGVYHNLFVIKDDKIIEIKEMFLESPVQKLMKQLESEQKNGDFKSENL